MKPKHQRLVFISISVAFLCIATLLTLQAFRENLVFFYTPTDILEKRPDLATMVRIGGLVEAGSVKRENDTLSFKLTDGNTVLDITYQGTPPGLFREGQGAVVEGYPTGTKHFKAVRVLTKHDEFYMPKEVVESLKKSGHWHEGMEQK